MMGICQAFTGVRSGLADLPESEARGRNTKVELSGEQGFRGHVNGDRLGAVGCQRCRSSPIQPNQVDRLTDYARREELAPGLGDV